jgi:hypothetical protein
MIMNDEINFHSFFYPAAILQKVSPQTISQK